ncbi:MAG: YdgA family protein [Marinobacter sp.]|nr:YdgA family protein [Marinobacter sp.]
MKKTWMMVGGVVLVVGAVAPWGVGLVTEKQWQEVTTEVNSAQPFVRLETRDYRRGYLSARFEGTVTFEDPASEDVHQIEYEARVSHGVTGSLLDFAPLSGVPEEAADLFPDEKPRLTLETRLWGAAIAELTVPALSVTDDNTGESLNMSGGFGRVDIGGNGSEADIVMVWPGMVLDTPDLQVHLKDFQLEQTLHYLRGEVWTGEGEAGLQSMELASGDQAPLRMEGFRMVSKTWPTDNDRRVNSETIATLDTLNSDGKSFGPQRVEFVMNGLNVDSWSELTSAMTDLQVAALDNQAGSPAAFEQQMASMNQISGALLDLAADGISFGFPDISLVTPEGEVNGELMIEHPTLSDEERSQMLMVMQRLTGHMKLSLPLALAENHPDLMMQLAPLIKEGMMTRNGDRLAMSAQLKDLAVDVNGTVIPLPPLF